MIIFKNMNISVKLFVGFTTMILFIGAVSFSGYYSMNTIEENLEDIFSVSLPSIDYLLEADRDLQQLLVAERSMIFTDSKSDLFKILVSDYEGNLKQAGERWEKYKSLARTDEEKNIFSKYEQARNEWMQISRKVVDGRIADTRQGRKEALDLTIGIAMEKFEIMRNYLDELTEINLENSKTSHQNAVSTYKSTIIMFLSISAFGLFTGIALMVLIGRGVTNPLKQVVTGLLDISKGEGDLTKRLHVTGKDEVGVLSMAFNDFIEKLQKIIQGISNNIENLSSSSNELLLISDKMTLGSKGASEKSNTVAAAAEEMTTSMNSISAAMKESSTNTNTIASATEELNTTVNEIAENADQAMQISDKAVLIVQESTRKMDELGQAALAVGQVVETIKDISEQVNLLSLNATIEAARAGEAGKGFAVVANEIKDLANQTSTASMDIKDKIENIQESSKVSLNGMNEVSQVIDQMNDIVSTIATAVREQSSTTREISTNIGQASAGIQIVNENVSQSSVVSEEITKEITQVSLEANEMASRSREVKTSAQDLSGIASRLNDMVNQFKI